MSPTTKTVCLTAFEATKHICITLPTLQGVKVAFTRFHHDVVMQHPYIFAAVLLLWSFYPQFPFHVLYFVLYVVPRSIWLGLFTCLGFERGGVRPDSIASRYQSRHYREATPRRSFFARARSYGAVGHEAQVPPAAAPAERSHPIVNLFWRFLALLCLYASLVVLLKYGD